jgi:hypothetical protein
VIATGVVVKVKLHKGLTFRNEAALNMSDDRTLLIKDMGNVTDENIFTFEYTMKTVLELLEMDDIDISTIKEFPFQA